MTIYTQDEICELFEYRGGELYWRKYPSKFNHFDITKPAGSIHSLGYRHIKIKSKSYKAHRLVFLYHHGWLPKEIDHIDEDKLNNDIDNLRDANSQNQHNRGKPRNNTSGYLGVHWHKGKWAARITINGKLKHLGYFTDKEEAHAAYCKAANKYHGEFANHG